MPIGNFFENIKSSLGFGDDEEEKRKKEERKQRKADKVAEKSFGDDSPFSINRNQSVPDQDANQSIPEPENEFDAAFDDLDVSEEEKEARQSIPAERREDDDEPVNEFDSVFSEAEQKQSIPEEEREYIFQPFSEESPFQTTTDEVDEERAADVAPEPEKEEEKPLFEDVVGFEEKFEDSPLGRMQKAAQGIGVSKAANITADAVDYFSRLQDEGVINASNVLDPTTGFSPIDPSALFEDGQEQISVADAVEKTAKKKTQEALGSDDVTNKIREWSKNRIKENEQYQRPEKFEERGGLDNFEGIRENLKEDPVDTTAQLIGEEMPSMLPLMVAPNAGLAAFGAAGAEQTTEAALEAGDTETESLVKGATVGALTGALERFGINKLLGSTAKRKLSQTLAKNVWDTIKKEGGQLAAEPATEGAQEVVANIVAKTFDDARQWDDNVLTAMTRAFFPSASIRAGAGAARLAETEEETAEREATERPATGARLPIGLTTREEGEAPTPDQEVAPETEGQQEIPSFVEEDTTQEDVDIQDDIQDIAQNEDLSTEQKAARIEDTAIERGVSEENTTAQLQEVAQRDDVGEEVSNQLEDIQDQISDIDRRQKEFSQQQSQDIVNRKQAQNILRKDTEEIDSEELVNLKDTRKEIVNNFLESREGAALEVEIENNKRRVNNNMNPEVVQGIKNNPERMKGNILPDRAGQGWLMSKKTKGGRTRYVVVSPKNIDRYEQELGYEREMEIDSLAQEAGFDSGEAYLQQQQELDQLPVKSTRAVAEDRLYEEDSNFKKVIDKLNSAKRQMRGETVTKEKFETRKGRETRGRNRRQKVSAIQDYFGLSDYHMNQINRRDVRNMGKREFTEYLKEIEKKAIQYRDTLQAKNELMDLIEKRDFIKWNNLRRLENFPPVSKMDENQLRAFHRIMQQYNKGDEFLSTRLMETVDNTDLEGVRTYREAKKKIMDSFGIDPENVDELPSNFKDEVIGWDSALAQDNEVYKSIIHEVYKHLGEYEVGVAQTRKEVEELAKKARRSREDSIKDRISTEINPTDELIVNYLEAPQDQKPEIRKRMTEEELNLAHYIKQDLSQDRDRLIKAEEMREGRDNYYTHVRRPFTEAAFDDGFLTGLKEALIPDEADINMTLRAGDSGNIVPLEKFFQFAVQRTGEISPTKNVVRSYLTYKKAIGKKFALDNILPKIKLYQKIILNEKRAETDAEKAKIMEQKQFMNRWLNHKRGEKREYAIDPYGKGAQLIDIWDKYVSFKTLALEIPVQVTAAVGEKTMNYIQQGAAKNAKGAKRKLQNPKKARRIANKYEEIVGRDVFSQLQDQASNAGQKAKSIVYGGFSQARRGTNLNFLLSEMTEQEYQNEEISSEKLGEIRERLGRFRPQDYMESMFESSPEGTLVLKFTDWATRANNGIWNALKGGVRALGDIKGGFNTQQFNENIKQGNLTDAFNQVKNASQKAKSGDTRKIAQSMRFVGLITVVAAITMSAEEEDLEWSEDETFMQEMYRKGVRELGTAIQSFDPTTYTNMLGMNITELFSVIENSTEAIKFKKYQKEKPYVPFNLKGLSGLYQDLTPNIMKDLLEKTFPSDRRSLIERKLDIFGSSDVQDAPVNEFDSAFSNGTAEINTNQQQNTETQEAVNEFDAAFE